MAQRPGLSARGAHGCTGIAAADFSRIAAGTAAGRHTLGDLLYLSSFEEFLALPVRVRDPGRICVLEGGRVVEEGRHEDLVGAAARMPVSTTRRRASKTDSSGTANLPARAVASERDATEAGGMAMPLMRSTWKPRRPSPATSSRPVSARDALIRGCGPSALPRSRAARRARLPLRGRAGLPRALAPAARRGSGPGCGSPEGPEPKQRRSHPRHALRSRQTHGTLGQSTPRHGRRSSG